MEYHQIFTLLREDFPSLWEAAVIQNPQLAEILGESLCEMISPLIAKWFVDKGFSVSIINGIYKTENRDIYHQWVLFHTDKEDIIVDGTRKQFQIGNDRLEFIPPSNPEYQKYHPKMVWFTNRPQR
jgi:hypothetical protein